MVMFTMELLFIKTYQGTWPFRRHLKNPKSAAKLFKMWTQIIGILGGGIVLS